MKKLYGLCLMGLFISGASAQNGQIWNGGFEMWTTDTLFHTPANWQSSNLQEWRGVSLSSQSNDAQHLSSSILLENEIVSGDSLFGYFFMGQAGDNGLKGAPYATPFDSATGYYKCHTYGQDTAYLIVMKSLGGVQGPPVFAPLFGNISTWTRFSFPVPPGNCDSVFFGVVSSNPFNNGMYYHPDTWIMIDNVALKATAGPPPLPLPNPSFETWNAVTNTEPDNWNTINEMTVGFGITPVVETSDALAGSKAAQLTTSFNAMFGDTIRGVMTNGTFDWNNWMNPFIAAPYAGMPDTFSGAYKYTPSGADNAWIYIEFYQGGASIGSHNESITSAAATYQTFTAPLTITGTPDSMVVVCFAGDNPGSVLKVDELSLSGGNVGIQEMARRIGLKVYPNPADAQLTVEWSSSVNENITLELRDLSGRIVYNQNVNANSGTNVVSVDVEELAKGAYSYTLYNTETRMTGTFIKR